MADDRGGPPAPDRTRGAVGPSTRLRAVVVCLPGLEEVVTGELAALGVRSRPAGAGALAVRVTTRQLYLANLALASATRVLVEAGELTARSFATLEARLAEHDLSPWLEHGRPVRLRVTARRSRLIHTGAIEERVRRALVLGPRPATDDPEAALLVVRAEDDRFTLRVDASGAPLHHRGWRGPAGKAPLRETLAAACLSASGWAPGASLVDPFCGSGTLAIEAARRAAGLAPGAGRSFAFERWPSFAPGTWASARAELAPAAASPPPAPVLLARDRDAGAVVATRENAERAGVAGWIVVERGAISDARPRPSMAPAPGWLVSNPPWGGRLRGGDVRDVYARLGQVARSAFPGWTTALLVADPALARATGLDGRVVLRSRAGALPVSLVVSGPSPSTPS